MNPNDGQRHQEPLSIRADDPVFAGHFPDVPVVPGVMLLSKVLDVADRWLGAPVHAARLRQAKFPAPWLPGMAVVADLTHSGTQLRFEVRCDGQVLALGAFELRADADGA